MVTILTNLPLIVLELYKISLAIVLKSFYNLFLLRNKQSQSDCELNFRAQLNAAELGNYSAKLDRTQNKIS